MEKVIDYLGIINSKMSNLKKIMYGEDTEEVDNECTLFYRGEPMSYGKTKLVPSMYRDNIDLSALLELVSNFKVSDATTNFEKMIDSQHFIAKSNLLDITFNALAALYFASEFHVEKDGVFYLFCVPNSFVGSNLHIENDIKYKREGIKAWIREDNFRLILGSSKNERVIAQSGGFIYFYNSDTLPVLAEEFYQKIIISASDKKQILKELDTYFNINRSTIYPNKEEKQVAIMNALSKYNAFNINTNSELELEELQNIYEQLYIKILYKKRNKASQVELRRILRHNFEQIRIKVKKYQENVNGTDEQMEKLIEENERKLNMLILFEEKNEE